MDVLDVVFANLYLVAVDADAAGARVPRAWRPLFARRADTRVASIQFAVAGMNAHINHDLPLAVVATCEQVGVEPETIREDYLRINDLLAEVSREVRQSYLDEDLVRLGQDVTPVLDLVGNWSIEKARDAAWVNAGVLWRLRDLPFLLDSFAGTLGSSAGLATGTLLTPLL
jgi:hypothetical protein